MAKSANQKLKLLYILKILTEKTDEKHCMSAQEIIRELSAYDISAERKSIYDDMECLICFGYDIVYMKARSGGGYYLASREFELPELKLLVDAVQSSRFITQKKSRDLISKIEKLAGPFEGKQLQRQVFVAGRVKTENESIYYNVDRIHKAIQDNAPITFTYLAWNVKKELVPRHEGKRYRISPWALTWQDENYYLIAYDDDDERIKHFRVDKMSRISELTKESRKGMEAFKEFDVAEYTNKTFGMFGGEQEIVSLQFPEDMVGIVLDRFGKDIDIRQMGNGTVSVRIKAAVSGQFYGWLTGLGKRVTVLGPAHVRTGYIDFMRQIMENYH
ncbi:helix-turn-helix transcriptional regulator [Parablautia muri]|uniref:WYL domain-containing protein n=1 Tax=Parablautia muri TaxID=2320879 RepID=A0A9X5BIG7_9FIRM|nr:WYL domain-containing protein [Parablautia muri]NBJ94289.1 WYL domain-containing protein [Parablautia muri]